MRLRLLAAVASGLLLLGCPPPAAPPDAGEDAGLEEDAGRPDAGRPPRDAGVPDAGFTAVTVPDWCRAKAQAECSRDVRCGRLFATNLAGCVLNRTTAVACDQLAYSRAVAEGRSAFSEPNALACLNAAASGSCEELSPACAEVFTGLTPPDGGCLLATDCNADGFCDVYDGRCPHHCQAWTALGQACDGFYSRCDPRTAGCDVVDAGGVTACVPKKREGDPCGRYDACGDTMSCVDGQCTKRRAGPGEPCGVRSGFPYCTDEYFCRQDLSGMGDPPPGTCQRKGGLGDTCTGPGSCLPSLRCSTLLTTGTCLLKAGPGEGCIAYDDCEDLLFCNAKSQQCEGLPDAGGDCSFERSGYRCAPGTTCAFASTQEDRCVAFKPVGAPCGYAGECLSNECEFGALPDGGFGGTCRASCSQRADGGL